MTTRAPKSSSRGGQGQPNHAQRHVGVRSVSMTLGSVPGGPFHLSTRRGSLAQSQGDAGLVPGRFSFVLGCSSGASIKPRPQSHGLFYMGNPGEGSQLQISQVHTGPQISPHPCMGQN